MEPFVRRFLRAALIWLGVGMILGLVMAFVPRGIQYRPAHVHANLLGFVSMMIFGVAYHVVPRFSGRPLHRNGWARVHLVLANAGLLGLVAGWILRVHLPGAGEALVSTGAGLSAVGIVLFIANLWVTLGPVRAEPRPPGPRVAPRRSPSHATTGGAP